MTIAESTPSSAPLLYCSLFVPGIRCTTHIGWTDAELAQPQSVLVDIALEFTETPAAIDNDRLEDTCDYGSLVRRVVEVCEASRYRLLERLALALYAEIRAAVPADVRVWLEVSKGRSPLKEMGQSARFALGDWRRTQEQSITKPWTPSDRACAFCA